MTAVLLCNGTVVSLHWLTAQTEVDSNLLAFMGVYNKQG